MSASVASTALYMTDTEKILGGGVSMVRNWSYFFGIFGDGDDVHHILFLGVGWCRHPWLQLISIISWGVNSGSVATTGH